MGFQRWYAFFIRQCMTTIELNGLRREFAVNKRYPKQYEHAILYALAGYPELRHTRINFELAYSGSVPYSTRPTFASLFLPAAKRTYCIQILERADGPKEAALLKNLPEEVQVAVIAHELAHVVQYNARSSWELIKRTMSAPFPAARKDIERSADIGAIQHGFGEALHRQAVYIRRIPGYTEERKSINKYYLKPHEIMEYLRKYRPGRGGNMEAV
jgi:hypothetical protein